MIRTGLAALALLAATDASLGADCDEMVARFDAYLKAHPNATGDRQQTVAAQQRKQPTRKSVEEAQKQGRYHLEDLLAKAQKQLWFGDEQGCRGTLAEVEWMLHP